MNNVLFSIFPNENFIDLGMYQYGWERCQPGHSFGPAARNHFLFHYVHSGTGTLMAEDSKGTTVHHRVKAGQGFVIFPGQVTMYCADKEDPWEYSWLEFDGLRVKQAFEMTSLSLDHPVYHTHFKELKEKMVSEIHYIVHHAEESPFHLIGHLYLFFDYLIQSARTNTPPSPGKMSDFYLKEAITFIEQNFQSSITVENIASVCGINRSYLGKIFQKNVGKSPQEFLIQYRMVKATEMLRHTDLPIAKIGASVGYENQLHFSRAFKTVYGVSPSQWRAQNR